MYKQMEEYNALATRYRNAEIYMNTQFDNDTREMRSKVRKEFCNIGEDMQELLGRFEAKGIRVTDKEAYDGFTKERMAKYK